MTRWSEWSPSDPAIARMREALERPRTAGVAAKTAPEAAPSAEESQGRRARIAALRGRLRLGDTSVIHELKDLLR